VELLHAESSKYIIRVVKLRRMTGIKQRFRRHPARSHLFNEDKTQCDSQQ